MKKEVCDKERVNSWIRQGKQFICFGIGDMLHGLCEEFPIANQMRQISDFNPVLWGDNLHEGGGSVPIVSPEEMNPREGEIVLITTPYHQQVEELLKTQEKWRDVKTVYYIPSVSDSNFNRIKMELSSLPIQDKLVFRSGLEKYVEGFDYSDNSRALFEYLIKHDYQKRYVMVWYVHDPDDFPELKNLENIFLVSYEWAVSSKYEEYFTYFYHLYTAKYLFTTDASFWMRYCRNGQTRVNLWHGCGFKDRKGKTGPTGKNYDFMTVTSPLYADIHAEEYGCAKTQLLSTGLAKQDWLFQPFDETIAEMLDVPVASKYVFWLPTFRMAVDGLERLNEYEVDSDTGFPIVKDETTVRRLDHLLYSLDMCMIVKLHPVQKNTCMAHWNLSNIRVLENREIAAKDLPINRLLAQADAIISDYSSIAVDYMLLDRPIAFMLEDMEQYGKSRGFVFENLLDYLPGEFLYDFNDLKRFLVEISEGRDESAEKRRKLMKVMHSHQDGNSCRRILEAIGLA